MKFPVLALLALAGAPVWAQGAVVELNQDSLQRGNPAIGDTPGAPITITRPGSYRLSGNIGYTVPGSGNQSLIEILVGGDESVLLDLNGFALTGSSPSACTFENSADGPNLQCPEIDAENGISVAPVRPAPAFVGLTRGEVVIRNGSIAGFRGHGVNCESACRVENLSLRRNVGWGVIGADSVVASTASGNGLGGIFATAIRQSRASANAQTGMRGTQIVDSVVDNTYRRNGIRATGVNATMIDRVVVQDTAGIGAIAVTALHSTIQRATTGLELQPGGNAIGNSVLATQRGIVVGQGAGARDNVINASAPLSGNPVIGLNICGSTSC